MTRDGRCYCNITKLKILPDATAVAAQFFLHPFIDEMENVVSI